MPNHNDNHKTLTIALQLSSREKYLRQFLRSSCDSKLATPDLILVCRDGQSFGHKVLVVGVLPQLGQLLGDLCENSHEDTKMILPDVSKVEEDMALD